MIPLASSLARTFAAIAEVRPDGELLAAFLNARDETAFAELVRRHGPLVWSACQRLLPDVADAEDAFQASFLVLVRRARRLTSRPAIGPWLYQVAVWTARNIRRRNARQLSRRRPLADAADPSPQSTACELRYDLDAALLALPEKYRTPLVLCHLQGWSRREAAARLGCPEGTLSSLLARGLDRLRVKLKGFEPMRALAIGLPAVPLVLANAAVKAATGAHLATAFAVSSTVSQLAEGVVRMFWIKKATAASCALMAVFGLGLGIGVSANRMPGAAAGDGPATVVSTSGTAPIRVEGRIDELKRQLAENERTLAASKLKLDELAVKEKAAIDGQSGERWDITRARQRAEGSVVQLESERKKLLADIADLNQAGNANAVVLEVVPLKTIDAERAALILNEVFNGPGDASKKPGAAKQELRIRVVSETSTNSLLILKASPVDLATIRRLVSVLEKPKVQPTAEEKVQSVFSGLPDQVVPLVLPNELGILPQQELDALRERIDLLQQKLIGAKLRMVLAADKGDQKARAAAGKDIETIHAELLLLQQQEKVLKVQQDANGKQKPKPKPDADADRLAAEIAKHKATIVQLESQLQALKATQDMSRAEADRRLALQLRLQEQLAKENKAQLLQASAKRLDITITAPGALWPYKVTETGADGKTIGTIIFDNIDVLKLYLLRTGKDAAGPKAIQLSVPAAVPFDQVKKVLEACAAAGLIQSLSMKIAAADNRAEMLKSFNEIVEMGYKKPGK